MINIGIIGCGKITQVRHLPEYVENPQAHLTGLYDINQSRAEELTRKYGGKAYSSIEEMLTDPEIDAVSVCTSNATHAQITIQALEAGKHVLCEKPMATTLKDCEAMAAAAKKNGKHLMIGHNQRLAEAHALGKKLIDQGIIGRILTFRTSFGHSGPETWSVDSGKNVWFFDKKQAFMGAMADLGIHKTDLIQFLTGQRIVRTTARLSTLDKRDGAGNLIGVDDNAICIYELSGGAIGTMTASWTRYGAEDNATVLYGTEVQIKIYDDPEHAVVVQLKNGSTKYYDVAKIQSNDNQTKSGVIDLWIDCLVNHREPEISGEEALHSMRAVFASLESSEKGKAVDICGEELKA